MPLPKNVEFVTFDCYGTLIDWEAGVFDAFQKEADRDGFTIDREELIPRFIDIQREIQHGSYELEPAGSGTQVTYSLSVELNIPMIGMLRRKAEKIIIDTALKELKRRVEGRGR